MTGASPALRAVGRRRARRCAAVARLLADRTGVSTIEFAVTAPAVALLATLGLTGLHLHNGSVSLDTGVKAAARVAALGLTFEGETRIAAVRRIVVDHVCPSGRTFCYPDGSWRGESDDGETGPVQVTTLAYGDPRNIGRPEPFTDSAPFNGVYDAGETFVDVNGDGVWNPDMGAAALGGSGDYVVYRVTFMQRVGHPFLTPLTGDRLARVSQMVIQNEPF